MKNKSHNRNIRKQEDIEGHDILKKLRTEKQTENAKKYSKGKDINKEEKKEYLKFLWFCQSKNFAFAQICNLGKYLQSVGKRKKASFLANSKFEKEEVSLIARTYEQCLLENLKKDFSDNNFHSC